MSKQNLVNKQTAVIGVGLGCLAMLAIFFIIFIIGLFAISFSSNNRQVIPQKYDIEVIPNECPDGMCPKCGAKLDE